MIGINYDAILTYFYAFPNPIIHFYLSNPIPNPFLRAG